MVNFLKKAAGDVGRFLSTTGRGALRKVGDTARTIRKVGASVDAATGGAAGLAFEASKSVPGVGTITSNLGRGLSLAEKASDAGIKAIDIGERGLTAAKSGNVLGAVSAAKDIKGLYSNTR
eukprot:SAG22_NODE_2893_length_2120_cov_98.588817_1_plen_121_part_00